MFHTCFVNGCVVKTVDDSVFVAIKGHSFHEATDSFFRTPRVTCTGFEVVEGTRKARSPGQAPVRAVQLVRSAQLSVSIR